MSSAPVQAPEAGGPPSSVELYRRSTLHKLATSPFPDWTLAAIAAACLPTSARATPSPSGVVAQTASTAAVVTTGLPRLGVMMVFTGMWTFAGYMKYMKDPDNGTGTTTAWCLLYAFLNARRTFTQPRPLPSLLMAGVLANIAISGRKQLDVHFGI
ncbi:hypothetical protein BGZ80_008233 [Entomortierella chlamydospora]|uniref:Uncharacterized protein n=1 Tax=Entomortierella chlamydospora TaxID=101097 RepID=A0A9P6MY40_9FUNG|nr:hypothetical protein BGZ80_008233 [Entomortierella chlamydospora]